MLPFSLKQALIQDADLVIDDICREAIGGMKHPPQIETDFAASFVKNGIPKLDRILSSKLGLFNIRFESHSVFIHQSPIVKIIDPQPLSRKMSSSQCELGDILVVQSVKRNSWKTYWRAVLWQLKKDDGSNRKLEDPQFWLYEKWPLFQIVRGMNDRRTRDLRQSANPDLRSGCFGLVSNQGWRISQPVSPLGPKSSGLSKAGEFLIEMMFAVDPQQNGRRPKYGRRVFTRPEPMSPVSWSQTIWDLLLHTGSKEYNSRSLFDQKQARSSLLGGIPPTQGAVAPTPDGKGMYIIHLAVDTSRAEPVSRDFQPL